MRDVVTRQAGNSARLYWMLNGSMLACSWRQGRCLEGIMFTILFVILFWPWILDRNSVPVCVLDILLVMWKFWPSCGARRKVKGGPKSSGIILLGSWMSATNLMAIHHIFVELFLSGLKWWTDGIRHCHLWRYTVCLKPFESKNS